MMDIIDQKIQTIKTESAELKRQVKQKLLGYIIAAFGLVAGLAWNEAIKALIEHIFPASKNTLVAKFLYAAGLTVVIVIVSVYAVRFLKGKDEQT